MARHGASPTGATRQGIGPTHPGGGRVASGRARDSLRHVGVGSGRPPADQVESKRKSDNTMANALIRMEGIRKVFEGEEILTHALDGIHLRSTTASTSRSKGRRAVASRRSCRSSACSIRRPKGSTGSTTARSRACPRRARAHAQPQIGFIFQSFNLIGDLSVYENVELPLTYMGCRGPSAASAWTRRSSVSAWAIARRHLPGQLSGGQQQRVAVARAVVSSRRSCWPTSPRATSTRTTATGDAVPA